MKLNETKKLTALFTLTFSLVSYFSIAAPQANNDLGNGNEDQIITLLGVHSNDIANGGTLMISSIDIDATVAGNQSTFTSANGQWSVNYFSGNVTFVPDANFNGIETITYTIENSLGEESNSAQLSANLSPVNDVPFITNNFLSIIEDAGIQNGNILSNGDLDVDITTLQCNTTPLVAAINGTFTVTSNGNFTYNPNANFNGLDMVVISVCDQGLPLPALCAADTLYINVTSVNDSPLAVDDNAAVFENSISTILELANDSDIDNSLDVSSVALLYGPFHGTATILNGNVIYTPNINYSGLDSILYQVCDSAAPLTSICDQAYIHINVLSCDNNPAADCDGDGVNNADELADNTGVNDPCDYLTASQTMTYGSVWVSTDCDGDGYTNGIEFGMNTDLTNDCDFPNVAQNATPANNWISADCDGDGVTNGDEILNNTNALNSCDLYAVSITLTPSNGWLAADCDGDGVSNGVEITDNTNPTNGCSFVYDNITLAQSQLWSFLDCDGDGVENGDEIQDSTYYLSGCDYLASSVTLPQSSTWMNYDCDGDGVINQDEIWDGTNSQDGCSLVLANQTVATSTEWNNWDCDEDGVINATEVTDLTNLNDPCQFLATSVTLPVGSEFNNSDCDIDGLLNGYETTIGTNSFNPDTDGDGINDGQEVNDGSDPLDPCSPFATLTSCFVALIIPEGISPNADTHNDIFDIIGADHYPNNTLTIYNRFGTEVYSYGPGYTNQWNGTTNQSMTIGGDLLPNGTYFYIFDKFGEGKEEDAEKGYVYIKR